MNILNYSLVAIISYLGLFIGFFLALIAKEEIKPGKKYFILIKKIMLLLIFVFLIVNTKLNYQIILLFLVFAILQIYRTKKEFNELPYTYIILAIIFYMASKNTTLFVIESSLIFIYGLPTGSLLTKKSKKETIINIIKNITFVIIAIGLFLIF